MFACKRCSWHELALIHRCIWLNCQPMEEYPLKLVNMMENHVTQAGPTL